MRISVWIISHWKFSQRRQEGSNGGEYSNCRSIATGTGEIGALPAHATVHIANTATSLLSGYPMYDPKLWVRVLSALKDVPALLWHVQTWLGRTWWVLICSWRNLKCNGHLHEYLPEYFIHNQALKYCVFRVIEPYMQIYSPLGGS